MKNRGIGFEVQQAHQHLSTSANSTQISDLNVEFSVPSLSRGYNLDSQIFDLVENFSVPSLLKGSGLEGVLPKSNSGMWNSKMSLREARFLTAFGTGCVIS